MKPRLKTLAPEPTDPWAAPECTACGLRTESWAEMASHDCEAETHDQALTVPYSHIPETRQQRLTPRPSLDDLADRWHRLVQVKPAGIVER